MPEEAPHGASSGIILRYLKKKLPHFLKFFLFVSILYINERNNHGYKKQSITVCGTFLSPADATTLATAFDFSGGQIENIARKHAIHAVLHGEPESLLRTLQDYCATEKLDSKSVVKRIGF